MKFKGKIDWWFWIVMLGGDALIIASLLTPEGGRLMGTAIFIFYNIIFLPFVVRNYVEVSDENVAVVFGFSKNSISLKEIREIYCTHNPISSTAASLDRIVICGKQQQLMCAVKDKENFFSYLKEKNPEIEISAKAKKLGRTNLEMGTIIFCLAIFVVVGILLVTGDIKMQYGDTSFTIEASYWQDKEISYDEIEDIEYRDEKISGSRTGGFGSFRLLMGTFRNDEFGYYTRYTYANCDAGVILKVDNREIVISGKDEESTKVIYDELVERCQK